MPAFEGTLTRQIDKYGVTAGPVAPGRTVAGDVENVGNAGEQLVQRLVAHVRAARTEPQPFTGFVELAGVLVDIEIDGVRCLLLETPPPRPASPTLSPRELEIARMVTKGMPNKSIAKVLQISTWTVSSHLRRVFAKLGVNSRAEMVRRLLEEGCLPPRFSQDPPDPSRERGAPTPLQRRGSTLHGSPA